MKKESENKKTCATKEHQKDVQVMINSDSGNKADEMVANSTLYRNRRHCVEIAIEKLYNSYKKSK